MIDYEPEIADVLAVQDLPGVLIAVKFAVSGAAFVERHAA